MIVRINQFDPANAEPYSGWGEEGLRGAIGFDWPDDAHAFEVLILESDERHRQLAPAFRQAQLRQLLPQILISLMEQGEQIVARLDGPMAAGELLGAMSYLTESSGFGRFSISAVQQLDRQGSPPMGSVRIHLSAERLAELCNDRTIGLDSGVRLRAFVAREDIVNPLLEAGDLNDERWKHLLPRTSVVIGSMRTMQSVSLVTRKFDAASARQRITQKLLGSTDVGAV